jgi:transketolase
MNLTFVPRAEFDRVRVLNAPAVERTALFATLARLNTLSMIAAAGSGHIGSSFSSLDIVSWLYLNEMRLPNGSTASERDIFFSSKGHDAPGLYAVLIALGLLPEEMLLRLRRLGGLPGHPDTVLTPFIDASTGSLGMGISKAKGIALGNRLKGRRQRIFVMTGDGELQEGQIWESLGSAARQGLAEITVIVDHNKIQSDTYVCDTADLGDLEAKFRSFGWTVSRCDGHDLQALAAALAAARDETARPTVIIADTIKGRGVSFMEHTAMQGRWYGFHSGAPSAEDYRRGLAELKRQAELQCERLGAAAPALVERPKPNSVAALQAPQRLVRAYGEALLKEAEQNADIVALDADLVLDTGLIPFAERFPDRFIECGIAEQDMVSQAAGLAAAGLLPVVHSFACFLTPRANEQIYNADCEGRRIIYAGSLAGLVPAAPGHSHQSVRDIALMGCLPRTLALEPSCEREAKMAVRWAVRENPGSTYIRLTTLPVDVAYDLAPDYRLEPGRGTVLVEGQDAVMIGYGPVLLGEAVKAAASLKREGIDLAVVNLPWLNRIDDAWLLGLVSGRSHTFTLDNHYLTGGQGERIAARLAMLGSGTPITCLGLSEVPACGQVAEVLRHHRLDADSLAETVRETLR